MVVEPRHPFQCCALQCLPGFPVATPMDQFSFVQAVDRLGQGIVVAVCHSYFPRKARCHLLQASRCSGSTRTVSRDHCGKSSCYPFLAALRTRPTPAHPIRNPSALSCSLSSNSLILILSVPRRNNECGSRDYGAMRIMQCHTSAGVRANG